MKEFEFGFSRRNINPPMKMGLAGYFNTRIWEKVLDDLEVRVAAFRSGSQQALLIQYDLIACPPEMFQLLKKFAYTINLRLLFVFFAFYLFAFIFIL